MLNGVGVMKLFKVVTDIKLNPWNVQQETTLTTFQD